MSLDIEKDFLDGLPHDEFENGKGAYEMVVAHETAEDDDSIARNKNVFSSHGWKQMSAYPHFFVDHTGIWQCAPLDYQAWGAGQPANRKAVHVELCRRTNEDEFEDSMVYYVKLLAWLLNRRNLGFERYETFWTHQDVSQRLGGTNHQDPVAYLKSHNVSIAELEKRVKKHVDGETVDVKETTSSASSSSKSSGSSDGSIVDYLKDKGEDSSFSHRKELAEQNGISGYEGTADQNVKLLKALKNGGSSHSSSKSGNKVVKLPASADTWKTYKLSVQPVSKNSDWSLTPAEFGGLEYDVLDEPYNDVVTIDTSKGKRNIYVGDDTSAKIVNGSSGSSNDSSSGAGKEGKLKITSDSGSVYVLNKPDRENASNLGTASGTLPLNGSVRGSNSSHGYWEVKYNGRLGYVTGNLGTQV